MSTQRAKDNSQDMDEFSADALTRRQRASMRLKEMREKARVKRLSIRENRKEVLLDKKQAIQQKKVEIKEKNIVALENHDWLSYAWRFVTYPFKILWMIICSIFNVLISILKHCGELILLIIEVIFSCLS